MLNIYCDVDGTLVKKQTAKFDAAIAKNKTTDNTWLDAWIEAVRTTPRPLNLKLLRWLRGLPKDKYRVIMWTNRSPELAEATIRNIGKWADVFDEFSFNGYPNKSKWDEIVEGFVIDDEPKFISNGTKGGCVVKF